MGRDDPDEVKGARLRISYHSIVNFDEWQNHYRTVTERAKWANTKLGLRDEDGNGFFVRSEPFKFSELARLEKLSKELQYYTDGVVLKVDDLEDYEELGHIGDDHLNPPRGALAWKFAEEVANATVKELEWNASRTGRVVPTAILTKPVRLADTDVTRATVNNYGWASKMGIGAGTVVQVKKAGKIIPNVCGVVSSQVTDIGAPENCPTCGTKLKLLTSGNGNIDLTCENKECGAKQIQSWLFFIQKVGGKGLGTSQMEKILATGKVKRLHNLFDLNVRDLVDAGFSERQAALALGTIFGLLHEKDNDKLLKQIEQARSQKRQIEAWKFFSALGIPGAGETVGKALIQHYKDFDAIRDASVDDLLSVPGIGQTTAQAIYDWFAEHNDMVDQLFLRFELELPKTGKLTGKNFVLTGSFTFGKKYWQERIEDQGGNIQSSVGKTTHYLIQEHGKNDGSPSDKEQKAAKLGIPVISVVDLEKMLSTTLAAKDSGSCHSNFKQPLTVF
jgi:DNA ligase (NAD+)